MRFFAVTARAIEPITAQELSKLGAQKIEPSYGGVSFEGDLRVLYRANLELRTASRILMPIRDFSAKTPAMLYDQVRRIHWETYLTPERTFAVECTIAGTKPIREMGQREPRAKHEKRGGKHPNFREDKDSSLTHSHYAALKVKDAIVDELRKKFGARPNINTESPDLLVHAFIHSGRCTISLDSSGASLHERGYRLKHTGAPLRETLAAAIVDSSEWNPKTPFLDPMCGSGTLVLEAALKALNIAPGLFRERFGFFGWPDFDETLWKEVTEQARARTLKRTSHPVVGYDVDRYAIAGAIENAKRVGLERAVHFEKRDIAALEPIGKTPGTLIVNPPYGERLGEIENLKTLYKNLGDLFKQRMKGWTAFIFTGNTELAKNVGLRASKRIILYNGAIECRLLKYELYEGSKIIKDQPESLQSNDSMDKTD